MYGSSCSETLRTIGQDLDWRGIRTFVIRREANLFIVEAGYQSPPAVTPVTLHYALSDIERLEREARERNDHLSPVGLSKLVPNLLGDRYLCERQAISVPECF